MKKTSIYKSILEVSGMSLVECAVSPGSKLKASVMQTVIRVAYATDPKSWESYLSIKPWISKTFVTRPRRKAFRFALSS